MLNSKKTIVIIIIFVLSLAGFIILKKIVPSKNAPTVQPEDVLKHSENNSPQVVSTKPDPLEDSIVPAEGTIEITFNKPLENVGEFKVKIEPELDFKKELSSDRKTAKITPNKSYELGTTYTIFIGPDSKFDGVGNWGQEKIFHFRTIKYQGI